MTYRSWTEVLHIFLTVGAAAVIWLAAHRRGRILTWAGVGALAVASIVHSFNDAALAPLGGLTSPTLGAIVIVLLYFF